MVNSHIPAQTRHAERVAASLPVGIAPIEDVVDDDGVRDDHAVIAGVKTKEAFQFARERADAASAGLGVAVDSHRDGHGDVPRNGADLSRNAGTKQDPLHEQSLATTKIKSAARRWADR